jgi:CubicO group peptidase (beta-lactamase class C family)
MIIEVAKHGHLLFSGTYGYADLEHRTPVTRESVFKFASITKEFTAAAVLTLVQDGKLKLSDTLAKHVPELPAAAQVRVYDLLVQTSGIPDYAQAPSGNKAKSVERTPEEMLAWIAKLSERLDFDPGTKWAYSNSNYVLLGMIAERVSKQPLAILLRERLLVPAHVTSIEFDNPHEVVLDRARGYRRSKGVRTGFENAAWISPTVPGAAGALRGTSEDLIRWNEALFKGRVLKPETLKLMIAPGLLMDGRTTKLGMPVDWQRGLNSDYGMGVFIKPTRGGTRIGHSGDIDGFSAWVAHYPSSGVTIVQMINSESADLNVEDVEAAVFHASTGPCVRSASKEG